MSVVSGQFFLFLFCFFPPPVFVFFLSQTNADAAAPSETASRKGQQARGLAARGATATREAMHPADPQRTPAVPREQRRTCCERDRDGRRRRR